MVDSNAKGLEERKQLSEIKEALDKIEKKVTWIENRMKSDRELTGKLAIIIFAFSAGFTLFGTGLAIATERGLTGGIVIGLSTVFFIVGSCIFCQWERDVKGESTKG